MRRSVADFGVGLAYYQVSRRHAPGDGDAGIGRRQQQLGLMYAI